MNTTPLRRTLVRTDPAARPQADISFVLRYFTAPGSTERASRNITGD
jgi:hypothetical protein